MRAQVEGERQEGGGVEKEREREREREGERERKRERRSEASQRMQNWLDVVMARFESIG